MIAHDKKSAEIKLDFSDLPSRKARLLEIGGNKTGKQFIVSGITTARLPLKDRLPVVLFEPDELRLLTSSPQRRRDFVDGVISRLSPTYSKVLSRYNRTLQQRNELLKQYEKMQSEAWQSHLFVWDVKLAELGATIIKTRSNFIDRANSNLPRIYNQLAGGEHSVFASYESSCATDGDVAQKILSNLENSRQPDALRGFTSTGPHRDDIILYLDEHLASETASRGEMRTIMLAFKLLEVELQTHHSGKKPLILLDDVFSELDISREGALMDFLSDHQTIITATDLRDELKSGASIVELKNDA